MRSKKTVIFAVVLILAMVALSMTALAADKPADAYAKVNASYIREGNFTRYLDKSMERMKEAYGVDFTQDDQKEQLVNLQKQVLEQLLKNELLLQASYELGITVAEDEINAEIDRIKANYPDEETFQKVLVEVKYTMDELRTDIILQISFDKLAGSLVQNQKITDDELKTFYQDNIRQFSQEEQIKASHILVDSEELAKELLAKIKKGADFAQVARDNSTCPSSAQGGDLGFFGRGAMVPEFEYAAFSLAVGEVSEAPVKSQFGWHIIKVTAKQDAKVSAFDDVKEQVRTAMIDQRKYEAAMSYMEKKWNESQIEYYVNFTTNGIVKR